ncbi:MAG TPA: hypothetical protein DHW82_02630 [Spirochaetia bacterium]|nr:MAG: hypothetical protein A2Y41_10500 [Spirochaetes bacterium GWB1_36_13]HCL55887.1 hypothetical protein [Spirochaetia bacterium]
MDKDLKKILKPLIYLISLIILFSFMMYGLVLWEGIEGVTFLKCWYMQIITFSTIGYGDLFDSFKSQSLTTFNTITIFFYMIAVAYAVSNFTAFLIEGRMKQYFFYKKVLKRISKLENHYIICGIQDIGYFVVKELHETKRPFVVIEKDLNELEAIKKEIPDIIAINGDETDDTILIQAGIKNAKALIASIETDKDNLFLIVTAKELNKNIEIASKVVNPKLTKRFITAGAKYFVSPFMIGGMRIASELIRPQVVSFLDRMLRSKSAVGVRVEEVEIPDQSKFIGKNFIDVFKESGILPISYYNPENQDFEYNPDPHKTIIAHMKLIFIATPDQRIALEKAVHGV